MIIDILPPSPLLSLPHSPSFSHVRVVICVLRDVFLACVSVSESELLWGEFCNRLDLALPIFPYVSWLCRLFCFL